MKKGYYEIQLYLKVYTNGSSVIACCVVEEQINTHTKSHIYNMSVIDKLYSFSLNNN